MNRGVRRQPASTGASRASGDSTGIRDHVPVMLSEVLRHLALRPGDHAIDCTFGGGGYTLAMLEATAPDGSVLAIDRDSAAIAAAQRLEWVRAAGNRLTFVQSDFRDIARVAARQGRVLVRGVVADLGLSSIQLADSDRGFSFQATGPLDMRFDPTSEGETAADILRTRSPRELERIFRTYGEEFAAGSIARAIVEERRRRPITTTTDLVALIERTVRRYERIHPATRVFQALRIAVNDELAALDAATPQMFDLLESGGRLAIVTFHSLEDRIVKRRFRRLADQRRGSLVTRRPVRPSVEEVVRNPRSRSAKLRVIERSTSSGEGLRPAE